MYEWRFVYCIDGFQFHLFLMMYLLFFNLFIYKGALSMFAINYNAQNYHEHWKRLLKLKKNISNIGNGF